MLLNAPQTHLPPRLEASSNLQTRSSQHTLTTFSSSARMSVTHQRRQRFAVFKRACTEKAQGTWQVDFNNAPAIDECVTMDRFEIRRERDLNHIATFLECVFTNCGDGVVQYDGLQVVTAFESVCWDGVPKLSKIIRSSMHMPSLESRTSAL